jgi:hypothetical protein
MEINQLYAFVIPENTVLQFGGITDHGFTLCEVRDRLMLKQELIVWPENVIGQQDGHYIIQIHCTCEDEGCSPDIAIVPMSLVVEVHKSDE